MNRKQLPQPAPGGRLPVILLTLLLIVAATLSTTARRELPQTKPASAPTNLTAAPGNGRVVLSWTAVTGATSYRIYRTTTGTFGNTALATVTTTSYTNTGLTNGTAYSYRVTARNNSGEGPFSVVVTATPVPAPGVATGLSAVGGDRRVTLTWNPVSIATSYRVYRSLTSGSYSGTPTATVTAPNTTYADTGLENGPRFFYTIIAVNGSGTSARSAETSAYTEAPMPAPDAESTAAFRLLRQATWGPKPGDVERVKQIGRGVFVDEQLALPPSVYPDSLFSGPPDYVQLHVVHLALTAPDQLRQRVAWALHKIWVVSAVDAGASQGLVAYQRLLLEHAFGNYRDLMKAMTLTPAMGRYLTMVNNRSQAVTGAPPNENYAREVMQLFALGTARLNADGTPVTDATGAPVPAYSQDDVKALAEIFTGWTFGDGNPATVPAGLADANDRVPMEPVNQFHDARARTFLGEAFPAGATAAADLDHALDVMFNHPNVGPFVARQLIQQLVTSNPAPAYVRDIAAVFNNNGTGVRGDLRAVVRALLLHPDASATGADVGKLSEPLLFATSLLRALNGTSQNLTPVVDRMAEMGQKILYPPSVFSYFSPAFAVPATATAGSAALRGPEFQILTSVTAVDRANFVAEVLEGLFGTLAFDIAPFTALARDAAALTDRCNALFMGGRMTSAQRAEIIAAVRKISITSVTERANTAIYLALVIAHSQVDR